MAFTSLITAIVLTSLGVLNVEGTAKGAVPLDTLTFDKVFLNHTVCGFVLTKIAKFANWNKTDGFSSLTCIFVKEKKIEASDM